jgi:hypothetical protein
MSDYVNDALLGASPYKKQADEAKALVSKWDKTGLLDGLNEDFQKSGMATMLENQARQLISENSSTGGGSGGSNTATAGSEEWSGVALPLVRRIFGEIASQEFVSVQPMNLPSGLVFYLDFKYGKTTGQGGAGFGTDINGYADVPGGTVNSLQGKQGPNSPSGSSAPYGVGGLYGQGRYSYSVNQVISDALATDISAGKPTYKDLNFSQEYSASLGRDELWTVAVPNAGLNADLKAVRSFSLSGSAAEIGLGGFKGILPEFTKIVGIGEASSTRFVFSGSSAANTAVGSGTIGLIYSKAPTEADRGDFEDATGNATVDSLTIPEIDLQLRSSAIVAKTRKLKAVWTPELAQDLNAYHSVDAEAELTSMLSEYISLEIDLEILDMLQSDAVTQDYWSVTPGEDYNGSGNSESSWDITTFYGTRFEWYQTLISKIQKVSNEIHRLTMRGGANFVVVSPKVATILESIPGFGVSTNGDKSSFAAGVQAIGSLQNRWTVYKNPYMTENSILIGFRGSNFLETGAVYAPYVPLIMTPLVYDPSDFTPRKGVMTRYAKKMIRPEFYGKIAIKDLNLV